VKPAVTSNQAVATASSSEPSMSTLFAEQATLYFWNFQEGEFTSPINVTAEIAKLPSAEFRYWLIASTNQGRLLAHEISSEMNHRWSSKALSVTWNHSSEQNIQNSWCFTFHTGREGQEEREQQAYSAFLDAFTQALWETLHQTSWTKLKVSLPYFVLDPID
jgi:VID27 PH-like domain